MNKLKVLLYLQEKYEIHKEIQFKSKRNSFDAGIGYGISKFIENFIKEIKKKTFEK